VLDRNWKQGDRIELVLDMSPHFWVGEEECAGKTAVYRGPILLTYDYRFNSVPFDQFLLHASDLQQPPESVPWSQWPQPWLLLKFKGADGQPILLCDFASAGTAGTQYHSWLRVNGVTPTPFSRQHPLRSGRP
jgi:hypothetical protein